MHELRLYCDVARLRSFSLAAVEHQMTQSAVSQRIGALEKRLGVQLIDRSVRPLGLTPAGELYLEGARDLLERHERLESQVTKYRPTITGEVRVDAIYSAGIDLLNHMKEQFETAHPQVRVVLEYKRPEEVHEAVRQQRCDLGLVSYPEAWRDVNCVPLRDERMVVVCAPGHALSGRKRVHASDLGGHRMIAFDHELPAARSVRRYLKDHGVTPEISSVFDNIDTIKSAVAVTGDIAILPRRTVAREVLAGTLVAVELVPELARPVGIIFRRRGRGGASSDGVPGARAGLSIAAQAFVDFLLEHAGRNVDLMAQIESQHRGAVGSNNSKSPESPGSRSSSNADRQFAGAKS